MNVIFLDCIGRLTDAGKLQSSIFDTLSTWNKIALARGSVTGQVADDTPMQILRRQGQLKRHQQYQDFVLAILRRYDKLRAYNEVSSLLALVGLFIGIPIFVLPFLRANLAGLPFLLVPVLWLLLAVLGRMTQYHPDPMLFPRSHDGDGVFTLPVCEAELVDGLCSRQASHPKDFAFAFRSVLEKLLKTDLATPDYSLPQNQIYKNLAKDIFESTQSMQFLVAASVNRLPSSPSWVADWSAEFPKTWLNVSRDPLKFERGGRLYGGATIWSDMWCQLNLNDENVLLVRGRRICTISSILQFQTTAITPRECKEAVHDQNREAMTKFCTIPRYQIDDRGTFSIAKVLSALWYFENAPLNPDLNKVRTHLKFVPRNREASLIAEFFTDLLNPWNVSIKPTFNKLRAYVKSLGMNAKDSASTWPMLQKKGIQKRLWDLTTALGLVFKERFLFNPDITQTHIEVCNAMAQGNLQSFSTTEFKATTRKGIRKISSTGICSKTVREGDEVALISGLPIPLIIRRKDQAVELISPAFIPVIMDGQAWIQEFATRRQDELEEFRVC